MIDKNREIKITECASRFVSAILQQGFKLWQKWCKFGPTAKCSLADLETGGLYCKTFCRCQHVHNLQPDFYAGLGWLDQFEPVILAMVSFGKKFYDAGLRIISPGLDSFILTCGHLTVLLRVRQNWKQLCWIQPEDWNPSGCRRNNHI